MNIILKYWTNDDKAELIALCNAVDRTYLSNRLPNPYTNADADWWLNMVQLNEGKNGVFRAIVVDGKIIGSISVERNAENATEGEIGYMLLTEYWSRGIATEAVSRVCRIAFNELSLDRIVAKVYESNAASFRVLEKNGFVTGSPVGVMEIRQVVKRSETPADN